jgi:hypothetical protein
MKGDRYEIEHPHSHAATLTLYEFDRYRNGKLMAEGARTEAYSFDEALARVRSWYSYADTFRLTPSPHHTV